MEDKALDWTASPKALEAAVHQITWIADLSLKKLRETLKNPAAGASIG